LPRCVPTTDMRVNPTGLVYGTASIPIQGAVCASCHSRYNGPISVAFRRFDTKGRTWSVDDIERLNDTMREGASPELLKNLVNESRSCWSVDGISPAQEFNGLPGFARILADSKTLGGALGVQIPKHLDNREPTANASASIQKSYYANGETLQAAIKGYLLSDTFGCSELK
jgi:hypothetical protein